MSVEIFLTQKVPASYFSIDASCFRIFYILTATTQDVSVLIERHIQVNLTIDKKVGRCQN